MKAEIIDNRPPLIAVRETTHGDIFNLPRYAAKAVRSYDGVTLFRTALNESGRTLKGQLVPDGQLKFFDTQGLADTMVNVIGRLVIEVD